MNYFVKPRIFVTVKTFYAVCLFIPVKLDRHLVSFPPLKNLPGFPTLESYDFHLHLGGGRG